MMHFKWIKTKKKLQCFVSAGFFFYLFPLNLSRLLYSFNFFFLFFSNEMHYIDPPQVATNFGKPYVEYSLNSVIFVEHFWFLELLMEP